MNLLLKLNNSLLQKIAVGLILICTLITEGRAQTPISGIFRIGQGQVAPHYTSLTNALTDIYTKQVQGNITLELQSDYNSSLEIIPITLKEFPKDSTLWTITIKPAAGVNAIITGTPAKESSVIKFANKATNYIIDGSNNGTTSRNLSIQNTSSGKANATIWLEGPGSPGIEGVKKCVIQNTTIHGGTSMNDNTGIILGGNTSLTSANGACHDSIIIYNNAFHRCRVGIFVHGYSLNYRAKRIYIDSNEFGPASQNTSDIYGRDAIELFRFTDSVCIRKNKIHNFISDYSASTLTGINLYEFGSNITVEGNTISNLDSANTVYGIHVGQNLSNILIANNSITSLSAYFAFGIYISRSNNTRLYFNSVNITGPAKTTSIPSRSAALVVNNANFDGDISISGLDVRNNVFKNNRTGGMTGSSHCIYWKSTNHSYENGICDYNDYYVEGPEAKLMDNFGTDITTLTEMQAVTQSDANSVSVDPKFKSNSHLAPDTSSLILKAGTSIPAITMDITGVTRLDPPSIGAYELGMGGGTPIISYTLIPPVKIRNYSLYLHRFATITDPFGISKGLNTRPALYYKKKQDANIFGGNSSTDDGWKSVTGYTTDSVFTFEIYHNHLFGGFAYNHDTIQYFVVAQNTIGNVSSNPSLGFTGNTTTNILTPPSIPNEYILDFDTIIDTTTSVEIITGNGEKYPCAISPNPYSLEYNIEIIAHEKGNAIIEMIDLQGRTVFTQNTTVDAGMNTLVVKETNLLKPGLYFMRLNMNGQIQMQKLVKN